ncbi:MAG TPA: hypothetical protein VF163_21755 [Micromonosporaceae bacterium]
MKALVILGAADGALSTYRVANELGYRTIAVDQSAAAPGVRVADEYLPISTRDVDAILAALGNRTDVAGVLAPCSDVAVPTVRALTVALGLPVRLTALAARASLDKWVLRGILDELGVPSYGWVKSDDPIDLAERASGLRFPVVVKPADAQGGRAVTRCAVADDVLAAAKEASQRSYGGGVMAEEEVSGIHCNGECIVDGGRVVFMAMTRQTMSPPPQALTLARHMPSGLPPDVEHATRAIVDKICARLEYQQGPLNFDVVVAPDGAPHLIELGLRTGGNGTDDMVRHCYGVDPIRAAVQAAIGEAIDLTPHPPQPVGWQVLTADKEGVLTSISGQAQARTIPEVAELVVLAKPGQPVRPYQDVTDRLGWFVVKAPAIPALSSSAERVVATLRFEVSSPEMDHANG